MLVDSTETEGEDEDEDEEEAGQHQEDQGVVVGALVDRRSAAVTLHTVTPVSAIAILASVMYRWYPWVMQL